MRILLIANYALDKQASMLRYAELLRSELIGRGHTVEVMQPPVVMGDWAERPAVRKWLGYVDKYLFFPRRLTARARSFDLVHVCDHSNSMYLAHTAGRPTSITCHDLLAIHGAQGRFPQLKVGWTGRLQQRWIARHLRRARYVVCVSEHTARGLRALSGDGTAQRIAVIVNALEPTCAPAAMEQVHEMRERLGLREGERYLLHVGGNIWYKNRAGALRIFGMVRERLVDPGLKLVMAGAGLSPELRELADKHLPEGSVIDAANPSDTELWAIYTGATGLLFPSWQEGFGWPLIEAQRCGCPVITTDRAPMTEVTGGAALYIDPEDEAAVSERIAAELDGLSALCEAGLRNAERFDAGKIAAELEAFFADVAGSDSSIG